MDEFRGKARILDHVVPISNTFIAAYLITIVGVALISNVILLMVLKRKRKLRSFHWCAAALSISDVLFNILLHPMSIATSLGFDPSIIFNHYGCIYFGFVALTLGCYNMAIHALLAIIRYVNICHLSVYWFRKRTMLYILITAAVYSLLWSSGPFFGVGRYETFEVGCTIAFDDNSVPGRIFITCAFIFVFFLPLMVIITSYGKITIQVKRLRKKLLCVGNLSIGKYRKTQVPLKVTSPQLKMIKLTAIIAGCFIIAWSPYAVVCLWQSYIDNSLSRIYIIVAALFCKSATAYNPFIYMFMSKSMQKETSKMFYEFIKTCYHHESAVTASKSSRKSSYVRTSLKSSWIYSKSSRYSQQTSHV
ncbi:opsin-5-like [Centruroides vittatus]|uniref:opsin-5-like n=1 Tax=Centruroides vittatus TaxID=120091 RepID=UPI00350EAD97